MGQKKITDYQLISAITSTVNFFVDDLTQNYRATAQQIKEYVLANGNIVSAMLADLAVTTAKIAANAVTDAKTDFKSPTITRYSSGSGTYTVPTGVKWLRVRMVGGGGGGGSGASASGTSGNGSDSTFGTSLLTANGAAGRPNGNGYYGGVGAGNTVNTPAIDVASKNGGNGDSGDNATNGTGGKGGDSAFGPGGIAGTSSSVGGAGTRGAGGGGGGGGTTGGGAGAGAGGYVDAIIPAPLNTTYSYSVGTGGTGGASGGGASQVGGAGGAGFIVIEEHYQ